jgi:hypothetical protein
VVSAEVSAEMDTNATMGLRIGTRESADKILRSAHITAPHQTNNRHNSSSYISVVDTSAFFVALPLPHASSIHSHHELLRIRTRKVRYSSVRSTKAR